MTDTDRLRDAATVLDRRNDFMQPDPDPEWATTAALLRAVAYEAVCHCGPEWLERGMHNHDCPRERVMGDTYDAALALASVILGDSSD